MIVDPEALHVSHPAVDATIFSCVRYMTTLVNISLIAGRPDRLALYVYERCPDRRWRMVAGSAAELHRSLRAGEAIGQSRDA